MVVWGHHMFGSGMSPGAACRLAPITLICFAAAALEWPAPVQALYAMCRTALASEEGRTLVAAFRSGILVLLAAPSPSESWPRSRRGPSGAGPPAGRPPGSRTMPAG